MKEIFLYDETETLDESLGSDTHFLIRCVDSSSWSKHADIWIQTKDEEYNINNLNNSSLPYTKISKGFDSSYTCLVDGDDYTKYKSEGSSSEISSYNEIVVNENDLSIVIPVNEKTEDRYFFIYFKIDTNINLIKTNSASEIELSSGEHIISFSPNSKTVLMRYFYGSTNKDADIDENVKYHREWYKNEQSEVYQIIVKSDTNDKILSNDETKEEVNNVLFALKIKQQAFRPIYLNSFEIKIGNDLYDDLIYPTDVTYQSFSLGIKQLGSFTKDKKKYEILEELTNDDNVGFNFDLYNSSNNLNFLKGKVYQLLKNNDTFSLKEIKVDEKVAIEIKSKVLGSGKYAINDILYPLGVRIYSSCYVALHPICAINFYNDLSSFNFDEAIILSEAEALYRTISNHDKTEFDLIIVPYLYEISYGANYRYLQLQNLQTINPSVTSKFEYINGRLNPKDNNPIFFDNLDTEEDYCEINYSGLETFEWYQNGNKNDGYIPTYYNYFNDEEDIKVDLISLEKNNGVYLDVAYSPEIFKKTTAATFICEEGTSALDVKTFVYTMHYYFKVDGVEEKKSKEYIIKKLSLKTNNDPIVIVDPTEESLGVYRYDHISENANTTFYIKTLDGSEVKTKLFEIKLEHNERKEEHQYKIINMS